ncbi:MAG TPA: S1 family peptidase [Frankiaceae bacterium]|jgi:hypothetical protein|nr:S1 family peptidase [Frankiaceae bacterium]
MRGIRTRLGIGTVVLAAAALAAVTAPAAPATGAPLAGLAPPSAPAPTGPFAEDVRFRRSSGINADPAYIARLYDADRAGVLPGASRSLGVLLTAAEQAELDQRERVLQDDAPLVREWAASKPRDAFGGVLLDHVAGGRLVVLVTSSPAAARAELAERLRHPEALDVRHVERSLASLEAVQRTLRNVDDSRVDVRSTVIDVARNVVVVGVASDIDTARAVLPRYVPAQAVEVQQGTGGTDSGTTARNSPPFRGGQKVTRYGSAYSCTLGFTGFTSGSITTYFVLTAGHCGSVGSFWYQPTYSGGYLVGDMDRNATSATTTPRADAAAMSILASERSSQIVVNYNGETYRNIASAEPWAGDTVGERDCLAGYASNYRCGYLLYDSLDVTTDAGKSFIYMREVGYASMPGDSGGPHFDGSRAHGIQSGNLNSNGHAYYSRVYDVLVSLGLSGLVYG